MAVRQFAQPNRAAQFVSLDVLSYCCDRFVEWVREQIADNFLVVEAAEAHSGDFGLELRLTDGREAAEVNDDALRPTEFGYELDLSCDSAASLVSSGEDATVAPFCELVVEWQYDGTPIARVVTPKHIPLMDWPRTQRQFHELKGAACHDEQATAWLRQHFWKAKAARLAIQRRYSSLRRFGQALVAAQPEYFREGIVGNWKAVRRLTREKLAKDLGWCPSVVGRAAKSKMLRTPWGECVPVENLLDGRGGERAVIVDCLLALIREEDVRCPMSDELLAIKIFERTGIRVSRRTVTNLRHELGIGSVHERRREGVCRQHRSVA